MVDSRLKIYFEDACEILDALNIEYGPIDDVLVNNRYTATWGTTKHMFKTDSYIIQISRVLLEDGVSYEAVMDTMIHELLHCHKDRMNHGPEWKMYANMISEQFGFNIKRTTTAAEKNMENAKVFQHKYIITCDECGAMNGFRRKSAIVKALLKNPVGSCKCTICQGQSFTVTEC